MTEFGGDCVCSVSEDVRDPVPDSEGEAAAGTVVDLRTRRNNDHQSDTRSLLLREDLSCSAVPVPFVERLMMSDGDFWLKVFSSSKETFSCLMQDVF